VGKMAGEKKQIFTIELDSVSPLAGKISENIKGESLQFKEAGLIIDFLVKNFIREAAAENSSQNVKTTAEPSAAADDFTARPVYEQYMKSLKTEPKEVKYPPSDKLKEELLKVSNFTEEELANMSMTDIYKAYNLIVRCGQKSVEDEIRKSIASRRSCGYNESANYKDTKFQKKEEKRRNKELKRLEKEARKQEKKLRKEQQDV